MYAWMKFVEVAPERYDWAVKVMTAGRLDQIKDAVAGAVKSGDRVLDIGCGTGTLALRCLRRGAQVTGLDSSAFMLEQSKKNAAREGLNQQLVLIKDSVTQLRKHFPDESFDVVVSTMALGEFPHEYLHYILRDCLRILRPGGQLIIADEVWPESRPGRLLYQAAMGLAWVPQFLLLRRVTYPISNLRGIIQEAGFTLTDFRTWKGTSLQIVFAEKVAVPEASAEQSGELITAVTA
jgi:demethylmenaquinone methyltransferase/2-methoxy-6-polyprenyl-1,4-benzoquinol methylase